MAARLGLVLYWIGSGVAVGLVCLGALAFFATPKDGLPILLIALVVASLIYLAGLACRFVLGGPKESVSASTQRVPLTQAKVDELNESLKAVNEQLGFPPGTGPTHFLVDGELKTITVGHAERMKNDPTYVFGNKMAEMLSKISDLENALSQAVARSDEATVHWIKTEIASLQSEIWALAAVQAGTRQKAPSATPTSQRGASTRDETKPITMADMIEHRRRLMGFWEKALSEAPATGNWHEVEQCARAFEVFHDVVRKQITSENFSGDAVAAASAWDECGRADREYRRVAEAKARWLQKRPPSPPSR